MQDVRVDQATMSRSGHSRQLLWCSSLCGRRDRGLRAQILLWERRIQLHRKMRAAIDPAAGAAGTTALAKEVRCQIRRCGDMTSDQQSSCIRCTRSILHCAWWIVHCACIDCLKRTWGVAYLCYRVDSNILQQYVPYAPV